MWCACLALLATTQAQEPHWKRLGGPAVAAGLAGPAGAPVARTWFSSNGSSLYAALEDGALWATADLGLTWAPAKPGPDAPLARQHLAGAERGPRGALLVRNPYRPRVVYALGEHLLRSVDGGGAWTNLTAVGSGSVIGRWQSDLAIAPSDPDLIVVANTRGIWKSFDAGTTWSSLNRTLPNFPASRFLAAGSPDTPQLWARGVGALELRRTARGPVWAVTTSASEPSWTERAARERPRAAGPPPVAPPGFAASRRVWRDGVPVSGDLTQCLPGQGCGNADAHAVSALAENGLIWAGTSNGFIWVSRDAGQTWHLSWTDPEHQLVASLWTDPERPATALAVAGNRVLRSTDGGSSWLDLSAGLPASAWQAIAGHPEAGTVYVAGPLGVYCAAADLAWPTPAGRWRKLTGSLPTREARDLALDPGRGRLYVLLAGHGAFWSRVPQVEQALQALSAADLAYRPAAPGSLLTILGASAVSARASGRPAPILDVEPGRTQLQLPFAIRGRTVRLQIEEQDARHVVELPLQEVSPAIFVSGGEGLILDAGTGTLVGWSRPARPGGSVLVLATGLGTVTPPLPAGQAAPQRSPPRPTARIQARLNGAPVAVVSAQLAADYIGIYAVEVRIPPGADLGRGLLSLVAGGRHSNEVGLVIGQ